MLSSFWQWLSTASQGQAAFVGALTGSFFGLLALLLGALANAGLNRNRDNRLRREDQRAVATALRAELEVLHRILKENAEDLRQEAYVITGQEINVQDLAQSIRIMPKVISKLGLLDGKTIGAVITAYGMAEEYSAKLLLLGGRPGVTPDNFKRYVTLPPNLLTKGNLTNDDLTSDLTVEEIQEKVTQKVALLNDVTAEVIQEAIDHLGTTRRWREMTWRERWRWLRTTG